MNRKDLPFQVCLFTKQAAIANNLKVKHFIDYFTISFGGIMVLCLQKLVKVRAIHHKQKSEFPISSKRRRYPNTNPKPAATPHKTAARGSWAWCRATPRWRRAWARRRPGTGGAAAQPLINSSPLWNCQIVLSPWLSSYFSTNFCFVLSRTQPRRNVTRIEIYLQELSKHGLS